MSKDDIFVQMSDLYEPELSPPLSVTDHYYYCFYDIYISDFKISSVYEYRRYLKAIARENHPELINGCDQEGETVLHSWRSLCKLWPFEHVLKREYMSAEWRSSFIRLLGKHDKEKRKPLHLAAELQGYDDKGGDIEVDVEQIVELLLAAWKSEKFRYPKQYQCFDMDKNGHTPLTRAVFLRRQKLTLCCMLRHHLSQRMENGEVADILFKAIEYEWHEIVKFIILYEASSPRVWMFFVQVGRTPYMLGGKPDPTPPRLRNQPIATQLSALMSL